MKFWGGTPALDIIIIIINKLGAGGRADIPLVKVY